MRGTFLKALLLIGRAYQTLFSVDVIDVRSLGIIEL